MPLTPTYDVEITEGWTGVLLFDLQIESSHVVFSTQDTLSAIVKTRRGGQVNVVGDVTLISTSTSYNAQVLPDAGDFLSNLAPYTLRFQVRDTSSRDVFFPSGAALTVMVYPR